MNEKNQIAKDILDQIIKRVLVEITLPEWTDDIKMGSEFVIEDRRELCLVKNSDFKTYSSLCQNVCIQLRNRRINGDKMNAQIVSYASLCEDRQDCMRFLERHFTHENPALLKIHRGERQKNEFWLSAMVRFMLAPPPNTAYNEKTPIKQIKKFKYTTDEVRTVMDEENDTDCVDMIHDLMHVYSIMGNDIDHLPVRQDVFSDMDVLTSPQCELSSEIKRECLVLARNTSLVQWYNAKDESAAYNKIVHRTTKPALKVHGINKTRREIVLHDTYGGILRKQCGDHWKYLNRAQEDIAIQMAREKNAAVSDSFNFPWVLPETPKERDEALKTAILAFHYDDTGLKNINKTHYQLAEEETQKKRKRAILTEEYERWAITDSNAAEKEKIARYTTNEFATDDKKFKVTQPVVKTLVSGKSNKMIITKKN